MSKYDEAIAFLKGVEPGSYFDECAALMEELLAQVHQRKRPRTTLTQADLAERRAQSFGAEAWHKRNSPGFLRHTGG